MKRYFFLIVFIIFFSALPDALYTQQASPYQERIDMLEEELGVTNPFTLFNMVTGRRALIAVDTKSQKFQEKYYKLFRLYLAQTIFDLDVGNHLDELKKKQEILDLLHDVGQHRERHAAERFLYHYYYDLQLIRQFPWNKYNTRLRSIIFLQHQRNRLIESNKTFSPQLKAMLHKIISKTTEQVLQTTKPFPWLLVGGTALGTLTAILLFIYRDSAKKAVHKFFHTLGDWFASGLIGRFGMDHDDVKKQGLGQVVGSSLSEGAINAAVRSLGVPDEQKPHFDALIARRNRLAQTAYTAGDEAPSQTIREELADLDRQIGACVSTSALGKALSTVLQTGMTDGIQAALQHPQTASTLDRTLARTLQRGDTTSTLGRTFARLLGNLYAGLNIRGLRRVLPSTSAVQNSLNAQFAPTSRSEGAD